MAPFNLPWSTFGAFLVLAATVLFAAVWALRDRHGQGRRGDQRKGGRP